MALKLAYRWLIMQTMVHIFAFATLQSDHFPNRSYRLFSVWPPLPDEVLEIASQRVQKRNHDGHRVDLHRFPNTYDGHDDHVPMYKHHAVNEKKKMELKL